MHTLTFSISKPEALTDAIDDDGHASEDDQSNVIETHCRFSIREKVHEDAIDGENTRGAIRDTLLRLEHSLNQLWPLEIDL